MTAKTEEPVETAPFHPEGGGHESGDLMCTACGWTFSMICPECPGCGCYNGQCTGWRHGDYADNEDGDGSCDSGWCMT